MPRIVSAEGKQYSFPDDVTDDEISQVLNSAPPAQPTAPASPQPPAPATSPEPPADNAFTGMRSAGKGMVRDDQKVDPEAGKTRLMSMEGLGSIANATSVTLGQAVNTAGRLLMRPEAGPQRLSREDNQKLRGMIDAGMPFSEAHKAVRAEADALQKSALQQYDDQSLREAQLSQEAMQQNTAENPTEALRLTQQGATSLALTTPSLVVGAATRNLPLALAVGSAPAFPLAYDESRLAGSDNETAMRSATLQTAAEAAGELLPMHKLLKDVGKEGVTKLAMDYVVRETGSEILTTGAQETIKQLVDTPEQDWKTFGEHTLKAMIDTAIITPFTGGAGAVIAHSIAPKRKEPAEVVQPLIDQMQEAAQAGDSERVGVLHEEVKTALEELNAGVLNGGTAPIPPAVFSEPIDLTPEREADILELDPLEDDQLNEKIAGYAPPPLPPELANDGTSAVGVDTALDSQIGNTLKVRVNAENYTNDPNDEVPVSQRKVLFGAPELKGQQLRAVKLPTGVTTVGQESDSRGLEVLEGVHDLYSSLQQQFLPNSKIIITPQTLKNSQAIGATQRLESGEYVVVPPQARRVGRTGDLLDPSSFNPHSKAKVLDNVHHEFGHILIMDKFFEAVPPQVRLQFEKEQLSGVVSEQTIAQFPPENQALIRDYMQHRADMKSNNATWFQSRWMSPSQAVQRLLTKDMGGYVGMPAESFVRRLVARGNPVIDSIDRKMKRARTMDERRAVSKERDEIISELASDYLNFHEFAAEQMARYGYDKGGKLPATTNKLFGGGRSYVSQEEDLRTELLRSDTVLMQIEKSLRALFIALKKGIKLASGQTYRIKAGVAFEEWLASLSRTGQLMNPTVIGAEIVGTKAEKAAPASRLPEIAQTEEAAELRRTISKGKFSPKQKAELYKLLRENAPITAHERMVEMLDAKVRTQLGTDPVQTSVVFAGLTETQAQDKGVQAVAQKAWNSQKESSMFFKGWFGDWEAGQGSQVVAADGKPLVMFHATQGDFESFTRGDIGFHFGNLMAAHSRMYKITNTVARSDDLLEQAINERIDYQVERGVRESKLKKTERILSDKETDWSIIPAYLSIKNPIVLSEDGHTAMWNDPIELSNKLVTEGIISWDELKVIADGQKDFQKRFDITDRMIRSEGGNKIRYQMFQPLRALLESKGFDGIKYENYVEGGTSWVAFKSSQVKSAVGNATFSESSKVHYQTDVDLANPVGLEIDTLSRTLDKYNTMGLTSRALRQLARTQWYVLQLQQLAWIHPEFHFLELADLAAKQYTASKSALQAQGEGVAQKWKTLGKETDAKLSKALEAEADAGAHWTKLEKVSGTEWVHVMTAETVAQLEKYGIDINTAKGKKAAEIYLESKNVILKQMNAAQITLARRMGQLDMPEAEFTMALNDMKRSFKALREKPFLPRGDYGSWGLVVTEQDGRVRKVVYRQMFESEKDLAKAREIATKSLKPNQTIKTITRLSDEHKSLLALPLEYVDKAAEAMALTKEQKDLLFDLLHPVKTERLLQPYEKALEKISGGSKDRMRNFADFVWHNSTMIARTESIPALNRAQAAGKAMFAEVNSPEVVMSEEARQRLLSDIKRAILFLDKTTGYMLSPPNEWYTARSVVSLIYLWGSFKTAILNITGITTTISAVTSQYGDVAGAAALGKAHKQLAQLVATGKSDELSTKLYDKALAEGFLIQSYAAHLAGAATAGVSKRMVNRSRFTADVGAGVSWLADAGMLPFTLAEQYTRRLTFLSVVNALADKAKVDKQAISPEAIYTEAVKQTDLLQNSYTLANRPVLMRGTGAIGALGPLVTIFMSFAVHYTWNASGGYSLGVKRRAGADLMADAKSPVSHTQRMLIMLLLLGGYEALPFVENLLDILDTFFMKIWHKPARQMLREGIKELPDGFDDPRWWGKGLGGDVFGADVSSSLGIGRIIPGTDLLLNEPQNAAELMGRAVEDFGGVAGGLANWSVQTSMDVWNGNDLTKNMTKFPGVVGGVANAIEWDKNGVRGTKGELLYEPTKGEVVAKAFNFNPAGLAEKREENWAVAQAVKYWTNRRANLQKHYNQAMDAEDREGIADSIQAIEDFNGQVMDNKLKILPWQRNKSYREHRATQRDLEAGRTEKRVRNLTEGVEESFSDEEE
jgi:ADP-Ribosyltransferase in polyvalent proteins